MSTFERYLTVWVALCIVAGVALGHFFRQFFMQSDLLKSPGSTFQSLFSSGS